MQRFEVTIRFRISASGFGVGGILGCARVLRLLGVKGFRGLGLLGCKVWGFRAGGGGCKGLRSQGFRLRVWGCRVRG